MKVAPPGVSFLFLTVHAAIAAFSPLAKLGAALQAATQICRPKFDTWSTLTEFTLMGWLNSNSATSSLVIVLLPVFYQRGEFLFDTPHARL